MITVRNVFQAKYGKGGEPVALFKEVQQSPATAKYAPKRSLTVPADPFLPRSPRWRCPAWRSGSA